MLYCGTHTSLYKSLPPRVIPILEDAILKSRLKQFDAAEFVFDNEHAETLLNRYKLVRMRDVLVKAHIEQSSADEEQDVRRLTMLTLELVKMLMDGKYEEGVLEEIQQLKSAWESKPVDEYTDIQVNCIRKYRLACILLGSASSFIMDDLKLLPKPNATDGPPASWRGLTDLRISLIAQSRFMDIRK